MLIHDFLIKASKLFGENEAAICGDIRINYSELFERAEKLASFFQSKGLKKGDVISIIHFNCHYYIEAYFAASMCGLILNSVNVRLSSNEIKFILENSGSKLLIANQRYLKQMEPLKPILKDILWTDKNIPKSLKGEYIETIYKETDSSDFTPVATDDSDVAHLYYTSGTTGKPKGVMLTHKNVTTHAVCAIAEFKISENDNWLHAAPMFHLADAWAVFAFTAVGAKHTMVNDFKEERVLSLIEKENVTISNMIPTMLNMLINFEKIKEFNMSSLRVILSGGAPIAPELVKKIIEIFGCDYIQTYGMTETSPYLTVSILKSRLLRLSKEEQLNFKSKTGREFLGVSLRVVREDGTDVVPNGKEVGEIIVKGDIVTPGYWKNKEATEAAFTEQGWLKTGDLANIDSEGYVNIVDRKKDMIVTGGENVYSTEVEYVIYEHPAVLEVAVIGVPHEKWGEAVKAFIVLKQGFNATEKEIIDFVKSKIASYKAPKYVEFIESLPKTGSGKITKIPLKNIEKFSN
jgi:acyl-CoA synthetase (AMP-forming)/AMP-acid ligase II